MKKVLKKTLLASLGAMMAFAPLCDVEANDKLLEILKSKGILTEEQFDELQKESKTELKPFYKDGFNLQSADKSFSLRVGGRVESDFRYFGANGPNDTFDIRRARLEAHGNLYRYFAYGVSVEFADGGAKLKDGYIDFTYFHNASIQVGQFYYPFSNEATVTDKYHLFLEASSITSALAPGYDRGIQLHGDPLDGLVHYAVGVFNGTGDNSSSDSNDDFDVAGRVVLNPTVASKGPFQFWVGASGGYGQQAGVNSSDIRVSTESKDGRTFFNSGNIPTSQGYDRTRMGAEATAVYGPAMLKGEYLRSDYDFASTSANIKGGYVIGSYFLTGETKSVKYGQTVRQHVKRPLDTEKGNWGALELAARYSWFDVDNKFFQSNSLYSGFSAATGANRGNTWSVALNWYPNNMTRVMTNWVHSKADNNVSGGSSKIFTHDNGKTSDVEDALLMRFQIEF